jgi:GT2 family glycosyltransferase
VFVENPDAMAVTGLVVPYELETEAQVLFEKNGGFGRGFERKWYQVHTGCPMPWHLLVQPGMFGTGANMAYRRQLFSQIGGFDPALDVGTATNGGGDLEMFYRILKEGQVLVYEPAAIVRHRHRRDYAVLKKQITNNGSVYAYLVCNALRYSDERWTLFKLGVKWIQIWHFHNLINTLLGVGKLPLDLVLAEAYGCWTGLFTYQKACRMAKKITQELGALDVDLLPRSLALKPLKPNPAVAVRTVELTTAIQPLEDITTYPNVRIYITWRGSPISYIEINNQYAILSASRLCAAIVGNLGLKLLYLDRPLSQSMQWNYAMAALYDCWLPKPPTQLASPALPEVVPVSIVVATYDRPNDLPNCIHHLLAQRSPRPVEIVIVDNHPSSGITPPIVAQFPSVVLVTEPRQGLAYARNAGIIASTGDIIIATDDDVSPPPDWLEKLLAPFARPEVMAVTGNTLPIQLDTIAQQLFEEWGDGGLGRGFEKFEGNDHWFERSAVYPVPAWKLGATANAAFRATVFNHPDIGLMYEPLGPGMPSGVGEDTYLLYKIMKAGFSVVYEPSAFVWHRHRRDLPALRRQLYNYSKGIVSYQLTTLLNDRDQRALRMLFRDLPGWHVHRIRQRFQKQSRHPIPLSLLEIRGHLAGPWSLWRSHQRVRAEGKSGTYIPPAQRSPSTPS